MIGVPRTRAKRKQKKEMRARREGERIHRVEMQLRSLDRMLNRCAVG